jgi:hypothetical protein
MIKTIVSIVMSVHLLKGILLNMTSGAKRIVIIIDTLVNGNMMIKSKKRGTPYMVSASLKKNVYGYMYECYTSNTTMYSISFYLIKRKDNYENSTK